ncbi:hypothetical protein ACQ4M3_13260 [Leptolyngbya sp. AN03gr2]|uniref:hypothetical protein n=1 Tax=unclassified Leptolyngbya TaxID=2650499 RepID=UPI003D31C1EB
MPEPFIKFKLPSPQNLAAGPCPRCGRLDHWLNNIPLTAYCYGSEENPHEEWSTVIPTPFNPYLKNYNKRATLAPIEYIDRRPNHLKPQEALKHQDQSDRD